MVLQKTCLMRCPQCPRCPRSGHRLTYSGSLAQAASVAAASAIRVTPAPGGMELPGERWERGMAGQTGLAKSFAAAGLGQNSWKIGNAMSPVCPEDPWASCPVVWLLRICVSVRWVILRAGLRRAWKVGGLTVSI